MPRKIGDTEREEFIRLNATLDLCECENDPRQAAHAGASVATNVTARQRQCTWSRCCTSVMQGGAAARARRICLTGELGNVELGGVARVHIGGLDEALGNCLWHHRIRGRGVWLRHPISHLLQHIKEERKQSSHTTILEPDVPLDVFGEAAAVEWRALAGHVVSPKDWLVEFLAVQSGERNVEGRKIVARWKVLDSTAPKD